MGRTKFRIMLGLIAFAHLLAASEIGALCGSFAIWAIIFALAPVAIGAALIPGLGELDLPPRTPEAVLGAIGLAIILVAARQLMKGAAAHRRGEHDEARRRVVSGLAIASVPTCLVLSVQALAEAWP
jgi:hypothetical protein